MPASLAWVHPGGRGTRSPLERRVSTGVGAVRLKHSLYGRMRPMIPPWSGRSGPLPPPMKLLTASLFAVLAAATIGCGGDEVKYVPKPAASGKKATLPAVPTLPAKKKKDGDAYTIWGVTHDLR